MQLDDNKEPDSISGRELVLGWAYQSVYGTLWGMKYGAGFRPEVAKLLNETSPQLNKDSWLTDLKSQLRELEEFVPRNLVEEDWATHKRAEIARELELLPEPALFAQLIKANASRTVRKLVKQSKWLRGSPILAGFLWDQPERFLSVKASPRFPRSPDKQTEFLTRGISAMIGGYKPKTGVKYLATLIERCEHCKEKPAAVQLNRDSNIEPSGQKPVPDSGGGPHTAEQCRYSTWPCPIHHPFSPSISGTPWCGTC